MEFIVAVDGPAGSGKGTITKMVGEKENLVYIDTGALRSEERRVGKECRSRWSPYH